jgi:hypothetical protein
VNVSNGTGTLKVVKTVNLHYVVCLSLKKKKRRNVAFTLLQRQRDTNFSFLLRKVDKGRLAVTLLKSCQP